MEEKAMEVADLAGTVEVRMTRGSAGVVDDLEGEG